MCACLCRQPASVPARSGHFCRAPHLRELADAVEQAASLGYRFAFCNDRLPHSTLRGIRPQMACKDFSAACRRAA